MRQKILFLLVACGFALASGASAAADLVPGQILVKFKQGSEKPGLQQAAAQSAAVTSKIDELGVYIMKVPEAKQEKVLEALSKNPNVEFAEPDYIATVLTNDPGYGNQWGLENSGQTIKGYPGIADADIDAPEAWTVADGNKKTGTGILVAVLDTGVDQNHPDLAGKLAGNKNFTSSRTVDDNYGHGTHVAGIIAANTNNAAGGAGVCPDCRILNVKVLNDQGSGQYTWIANGIIYAANNGAKVINMSLGGSAGSSTLQSAIQYAKSKDVVIAAAAGNDGTASMSYPAAYTECIAVAATTNTDVKASFSNYGTWVDIAAPGLYIYSTTPNHKSTLNRSGYAMNYDYLSGTSMATPMVAGAAALVWDSSYGTSEAAVRQRLEMNADQITGTGAQWLNGRLNAAKALGL